ncbi:CcoQ/FixQ family Cbb3-type cytochrome c oxidase assembly chaperone [Rhodovibrio sodomensis]|uniref:CcoQ/FixQ family Cbb3-type cytochrome c oxidase assembly chaperone n=1 Tax=Rhodovibrio sodomensis TaxID=1088 RepID=A0ABS1DC82_9PROT|nr:cbb3-type cytochrome c oxidase subunit 3 [Rhodovibrio sodomensis]MBK1667521.1 CcoQ/FixQ family Cbb3-type cytochrome c oxidase assembly chaperone [Rhodovibrio sodomensis]
MELIAELAVWLRQLWVVWLLLLFTGVCAWALWPSNRDRFEQASRIPLEDNNEEN